MSDIQDSHQNQPENPETFQEFAKLMGVDLTAEDLADNTSQGFDFDDDFSSTSETNNELDPDVFDEEEFNPEKNRTKVSLQNNGVAKAAVVGGASLAVIMGGAMFFQSQLPKEQVAQAPKKKDKDPIAEKAASNQAALNKAQQSESETKAQLALAKQKDSLTQAKQSATGKESTEKSKPDQTKSDQNSAAIASSTSGASEPKSASKPAIQVASAVPAPVMIAPVSRVNRSMNNVAAAPIAAPVIQLAAREATKSARRKAVLPKEVLTAAQPNVNLFGVTKPQISTPRPQSQPIMKPLASPGLGQSLASNASTSRSPFANQPAAITAPKATDMSAELQQLASVGRYGIVTTMAETPSIANSDRSAAKNTVPINSGMNSNLPPLSQYFQRYATNESAPASVVANSGNSFTGARTAFANSQEILRGGVKAEEKERSAPKDEVVSSTAEPAIQIRTLLVGTSAKGSAVTPVLWGGGANSTAKFLLKLDEAMLDGNNRVAFPANTQFVVMAKPASSNIGLAELEVVSVIIKGMEFAPPMGSIVIRNDQGGLLIGEDYFNRDQQIANRDFNSVLSGALGNVGRILNQPVSSYTSTVAGGIPSNTNVVTNREPNILGAVLEGGFRDISTVWSQRNQQEIQALANKPNVYQIPQGRGVRVFINQSMTF